MLASPAFFKLRTQAFELVTLLWVDDFEDSYLDALELICSRLLPAPSDPGQESGPSREEILKFLRDARGMANFIDVAKIFRLFVKLLRPLYLRVLTAVRERHPKDLDVTAAALDLAAALFTNK